MKVVTPVQMREIDRFAIDNLGIPGIVLMENAGRSVAKAALEVTKNSFHRGVAICCGKGNNGGDGFVAARYLINWGFNVKVYLCGKEEEIKGDSRVHYDILKKIGCPIKVVNIDSQIEGLHLELATFNLIIDGLLGTGLTGSPKGILLDMIREINKSGIPVLSIDIPSGVNGETGSALGEAVFANWTITFGYMKRGLLQEPGEKYAGEISVEDISIPPWVSEKIGVDEEIITDSTVRKAIPPIFQDYHKGDKGKVLVVGGSPGMTGAPILSAIAAARSGAGMVTLGMGSSLTMAVKGHSPEIMTLNLPDNKGILMVDGLIDILNYLNKGIDCLAIGPGMSAEEHLKEIIKGVILNSPCPVVIDADGINLLKENLDILVEAKSPVVLTPHPGEFARILGKDVKTVLQDRLKLVKEFATNYKVILLLKGHRTIISSQKGKVFWNLTGNPALATAGSGDVLTGIISSLIAQGADPFMATVAGAYIHGMAGDILAADIGMRGIMASDIIDILPFILKKQGNNSF